MAARAMTSTVTHGNASTYRSYGCRCALCRKANTERTRTERTERARKLAAGEVDVPHGSISTYSNYQCRCDECREAWSMEMYLQRIYRRAAD